MNAIIDINRFWKLEKRNFFMARMPYIYIAGSVAGLYILSTLMEVLFNSGFPQIIYIISAVVIVCGPCFFEKNINKHVSIFDFTLPASTFEKFLSIWLKYVIIIPIIIAGVIFFLNLIAGFIPVESIQEHVEWISTKAQNIFTFKQIYSILTAQSIFMLGYFYFRKYAFAKTGLVMILFCTVIMFITIFLIHYIFNLNEISINASAGNSESFNTGFNIGYGTSVALAEYSNNMLFKVCQTISNIIFPFGMWVVCYFKLRETEI